jgi:hypothetical protein
MALRLTSFIIPGAKLLTPFGLAGQFATKGFRQRLREHYHAPENQSDVVTQSDSDPSRNIHMSLFLLDYVLDMGPASAADSNAANEDADPSYSVVELSDLQQLPQNFKSSSSIPR